MNVYERITILSNERVKNKVLCRCDRLMKGGDKRDGNRKIRGNFITRYDQIF